MDPVAAECCWAGINRRLLHRVDLRIRPITVDGIQFWFARCGAVILPVTSDACTDRDRCLDCTNDCYCRYPSKDGPIR